MKVDRKTLILAQFLIAAAALWLHCKIHPYMVLDPLTGTEELHMGKLVAFIFCLLDVFLVTALFVSVKSAVYGYILNGMLVIFGSVMMAHFTISSGMAMHLPVDVVLWKSTLPDIMLAAGDFFIGKTVYELSLQEAQAALSK